MRNIKKLITLLLVAVMMMTMSVTCFAEEAKEVGTIKVTNLSNDDNGSVSFYKVATAGEGNGVWEYADWAKQFVTSESTDAVTFEYSDMASYVKTNKITADYSVEFTKEQTEVEYTGATAGAYLIIANGTTVTYGTMFTPTYTYVNGKYAVAATTTVKAKASGVPVIKAIKDKENDGFVANGDKVTFTITTILPYASTDKDTFVVTDTPENLKDIALSSVKFAETADDAEDALSLSTKDYAFVQNGANYDLDLSNIIKDNQYAGKKIVITLTATVVGVDGYTNTAFTNKADEKSQVFGFTGSIKLIKKDADKNVLEGAKFNVKLGDKTLTFTEAKDAEGNVIAGTYDYDENGTITEVETVAGVVVVRGLDNGVYTIVETVAPTGYAINKNIPAVTISNYDKDNNYVKKNIEVETEVIDSKLAQLPFTGGMGTTLFTVLGSALMVFAAGLYFATKKRA